MGPFTTSILAALPKLASDIITSLVKDTYQGLKSVISRKWGTASAVVKSTADSEATPKSEDIGSTAGAAISINISGRTVQGNVSAAGNVAIGAQNFGTVSNPER